MRDYTQTMPGGLGAPALTPGGRTSTPPRSSASRLARVGALLVAGLFVLHGLAHAAGLSNIWGIGGKAITNTSTLLSSLDPGSAAYAALGFAWVAALLLFAGAAVGLLARRSWWLPLAFTAAGLSLALCVVWLEAAKVGLVLNALILLGLTAWAVRRKVHA